MLQCVLFDNDGTLVDSEPLVFRALAIKFAELGIELDEQELFMTQRGSQLSILLSQLEEQYRVSLDGNFVVGYRALVAELFEQQLRPIPGVVDVLRQLSTAKAVVSNGPAEKIRHALQVGGMTDFFADNVYSAYDIGVWKPDPGIYRYVVKDMGFGVEQCLVVEDTLLGVEAAVSAGIKTVFFNRFNETCDLGGVLSITHMDELAALITADF